MEARRRTSSTIPFGWQPHPENPALIVKHELEQETLAYLKTLAKNISFTNMKKIVKARTGRNVTVRGLQKILKRGY